MNQTLSLALFLNSVNAKILNMKKLIFAAFLTATMVTGLAQDVKLKITYKNSPLCNWEVTLKHGDVQLAKATSDKNGIVTFPGANPLNKSVDAFGYKAHQGGDKKWDVKGHIKLDDDNFYHLDFEPLLKDAVSGSGMPASMFESAWGLNLNDCGQVVSTNGNASTNPVEQPKEKVEEAVNPAIQAAQQRKAGFQNEVNSLDKNIPKKEKELADAKAAGQETAILEADIKEMKAKREHRLAAIAVADAEIAGNKPSTDAVQKEKDARAKFDVAKDERKALEKEAKAAKKASKDAGVSDDKEMSPTAAKVRIQRIKADLKLKKKSLTKDEKSGKYNKEYLDQKRAAIASLEKELSELEAKYGKK